MKDEINIKELALAIIFIIIGISVGRTFKSDIDDLYKVSEVEYMQFLNKEEEHTIKINKKELEALKELEEKAVVYYGKLKSDYSAAFIFEEIGKVSEIKFNSKIYNTQKEALEGLLRGEVEFVNNIVLSAEEKKYFDRTTSRKYKDLFIFSTKGYVKGNFANEIEDKVIKIGVNDDLNYQTFIQNGIKVKNKTEIIKIDISKRSPRELLLNGEIDYYITSVLEYEELVSNNDIVVKDGNFLLEQIPVKVVAKKNENRDFITLIDKYIENSHFNESSNLVEKYNVYEIRKNSIITRVEDILKREKEETGKDVKIRILYKENKPYAYKQNGELKGVVIEKLDNLFDMVPLEYEFAEFIKADEGKTKYVNVYLEYDSDGNPWFEYNENFPNKEYLILLNEMILLDGDKNIVGNVNTVRIEEGEIKIKYSLLLKSLYLYISVTIIASVTLIYRWNTSNKIKINYDYLTKLKNKRTLLEVLKEDMNKENVSIAYLDIDKFKFINDTYGHHIGDEVLTTMARRLLAIEKKTKHTKAFRIGGDEFIVIYNNKEINFDDEIRLIFNEKIPVNKKDNIHITGSYGVFSLKKQKDKKCEEIIEIIDYAMLKAKRSGRNKGVKVTSELVEEYKQSKTKKIKGSL